MNKPLFYTWERTDPLGDDYTYVPRPTASRVQVMDGIETFAYKRDSGNWKVYEATTGMYINTARWCTTRKAAVEDAKNTLERAGLECCKKAIEDRINSYGKSPYGQTITD